MDAMKPRMRFLASRQLAVGSRRSGFTLVEALVAVALTTILLWGLLQLYTSATAFSSTVTVEQELCAGGRAVLERMVREISAATSATSHTPDMLVSGSSGLDRIGFYAPLGDDGEVIQVEYYTTEVDGRNMLMRRADSHEASFGLAVERFEITCLNANGTEPSAASYTDDLPVAVMIEIRIKDAKDRATIALTSSAFLPGGGF